MVGREGGKAKQMFEEFDHWFSNLAMPKTSAEPHRSTGFRALPQACYFRVPRDDASTANFLFFLKNSVN